jgi:hypothetical protein
MRLQFDLYAQGGPGPGFYWTLSEVLTPANKLICTSVIYDTRDLAKASINLAKANAHDAQIQDHTGNPPG